MPESRIYPGNPSRLHTGLLMTKRDQDLYFQLGSSIAKPRKARTHPSTDRRTLGIAQQHFHSFENGRGRLPVAALPKLSETLAVPTDELLGVPPRNGKPGPTPKLLQQFEVLQRLPKRQQNLVHQMLEGICKEAGV